MHKYIAVIGKDCPTDAVSKLASLSFVAEVIVLEPDRQIDSPIATHPDTILCIFDNNLYCHTDYAAANHNLLMHLCNACGIEIHTDNTFRSGKYPHDCAYNALAASLNGTNVVIGNKTALCAPLADACAVNVKQGYASCCAAFVKNTVISADRTILKAVSTAGFDTYFVSGKDIVLKGYDTGFIGGAIGYASDTLCAVGDAEKSESGKQLAEFCKSENIELVSLCDSPLTDVGGIKFIPLA